MASQPAPTRNCAHGAHHTGPHQFQMGKWISCAPFERLLHIEIVEAIDGRAVLTMPFLMDFAQGAGLLHGGALVSLADTAVVMAIKSILPPRTHFATISMETRFLHPVRQGTVIARAHVGRLEDRTIHGRATVHDEVDRAVLQFTSVFKVARDALVRDVVFQE